MENNIKEKALTKAFAKIMFLKTDVASLRKEIREYPNGHIVSVEEMNKCLKSTENDLNLWEYIYNLIEKDI